VPRLARKLKKKTSDENMDLLQQFAAVTTVLALLGATVWLLRRQGFVAPRRNVARQLEVMERVSLGPQHSLTLVRVNGRTMLVGTGPGVCEIRNVETAS
jgi:flagellar biogenesis protein FliO